MSFKISAAPCALLLAAAASSAAAQSDPSTVVDDVVVTGRLAGLALDQGAPAAGRLGLTSRETPATIDVLSQARMQNEGLRTALEAFNAAPGVTGGALPGSVGVTSMRGFTSTAIAYLFDGVRVTGSNSAIRNVDTFNFERVEVLKGPASVLYGEGALAGVINLSPKRAHLGDRSGEGLVSVGSFGAVRAGMGGNLPLGSRAALRVDGSLSNTNGWADDTSAATRALTSSLLLKPTDRLTINFFADYFYDRSSPYFGSTLIPESAAIKPSGLVGNANGLVLDRATLRTNYNVEDGVMKSQSGQARARMAYRLSDQWSLTNELSAYTAERLWRNVEDVAFDPVSGRLNRNTTLIAHDHDYWSNRAWASFDARAGGRRLRASLGAEFSDTRFLTTRRFGTTTAVDRLDPKRGRFPDVTQDNFPGSGSRVDWVSESASTAAFAEVALNLTPRWLVVGGLRYDYVELDRETYDLNTGVRASFGQSYDPVSWRLGLVYDLRDQTQIYGQFSRAVTPVSSFLFLNSTNAQFDLSTGDAVEIGLKTTAWDQRLQLTTALYHIIQSDILTRDPANPALTIQGGEQQSYGVEASLSVALTDQLRVDVSGALLKSEFTNFLEAGGVDRSGNRPANVPLRTLDLSAYYRLSNAPVTVSASARHNGDFYTSNANAFRVRSSTVFDAQASWEAPFARVTARVRNLFDTLYADWSGYGATQIYLGAPRSFDLTFSRSF